MRQSRLTSSLHEDRCDNEADSFRSWAGVQHDQTRRRIEEFPYIQTLDELVQRRIEETKMQLHSRRNESLPRSPIPLSLKQFWSVNSKNSQLRPSTTTLELVTQFSTSDIFETRRWSTLVKTRLCAWPFHPFWEVWPRICFILCPHVRSTILRR